MSNDLANLEAVLNICANLSEIVGIAGGVNCVLWFWMPVAGGLKGASLKTFLIGLVVAISGLATPGLINWAVTVNIAVAFLIALISLLLCVGGGVYAFFTPFRLAEKTKHPNRSLIQVLNCLFFIPFTFPISLGILSFSGKDKRLSLDRPQVLGCSVEHSPER